MRRTVIFLVFLFNGTTLSGQQPATGFPPYGSFDNGRFDTLNRQNLNINFAIPIAASPGRGIDLNFDIRYDSLIWYNSGLSWQPVLDASGNATWGWKLDQPTGAISWLETYHYCSPYGTYFEFNNWAYTEHNGTRHNFSLDFTYAPMPGCGTTSGNYTAYANDPSGLYLDATPMTNNGLATVYFPNGIKVRSDGISTDTNGNFISKQTPNSNETDWIDSAGHVALKIIKSASTIKYQYMDNTGAYQTTTVNLQTFNIKTNYGCAGVVEYTGTASLPASVVLPNGQSYQLTYQQTPGVSGYYTGRVQRVTLPTGGYYEYDYPGYSFDDFISCATNQATSLSRLINDGTTTSTWQYNHGQSATTVTAPPLPYDTVGNQSVFSFNSSGQLTKEQYYQGNAAGTPLRTVNTTWPANGTPGTRTTILEDNATQNEVETTFDTSGNILIEKEHDWGTNAPGPVLRTTTWTYLSGSPYTAANIVNRVTRVTVADGSGTVKSRTDVAYDEASYINYKCFTGATQHYDATYSCTYTTRGNPTTITTYINATTPSGNIVHHSYFDNLGNLVKADVDCCQQKTWNYSTTTQYAYPDSITSGLATGTQVTASATYNSYTGLPTISTDANSKNTTMDYTDPGHLNRLVKITLPDAASTQITYTYDDTARTVAVRTPIDASNAQVQTTFYDGLGRAIKQQIMDAGGLSYSILETVYDPIGRPYKIYNRHNSSKQYWTERRFDAIGRPTKTILPDNSQTSFSYATNTATVTDAAGSARKSQVDGLGRLISVFEPDPNNGNSLSLQTTYNYNVLGLLTGVTQGSQTRTYVYDDMGRLTSGKTPETSQVAVGYQYNNFGLVTQRTDPRGVITTFGYDTLNRLQSVTYNVGSSGVPATPSLTYTYGIDTTCNSGHGAGCIGRRITLTDGAGSENYTYDNLGHVTQVQKIISGITYTTAYAYNAAGELTQITYPSGRAVNQNVDAIGRLYSVTSTLNSVNTTHASGFGYSPGQQVTGFNYGNNINAAFGYSADRLQLTCLDYSTTNRNGQCAHDSTTKFGLTYSYGSPGSNNGLITSITDSVENGRSATYTYDALYRLTKAVTTGSTGYPAWGLSETYDRYGNRSAQSIYSGCVPPMTCPTNSVTPDTATNRIIGDCYDANGNLLAESAPPCPSPTYTYDAENRLVNYSTSATYTYDGNGLRVKKAASGTTTVYIFSGSKVIAEYLNGALPSAPTREYIYAGAALLARIDSSGTKYYHQDHLSNRLITDSSGNTLGQLGHFPFGESWYNASNDKLLFTSYERDSESGNDYAMARSYVNRLARFSSTDPLGGKIGNPQSLNHFTYAQNNPISLLDPSGMDPCLYFLSSNSPVCYTANGGTDWTNSYYNNPGYWDFSGGCFNIGIPTPCIMVFGALRIGAAAQCPNNECPFNLILDRRAWKRIEVLAYRTLICPEDSPCYEGSWVMWVVGHVDDLSTDERRIRLLAAQIVDDTVSDAKAAAVLEGMGLAGLAGGVLGDVIETGLEELAAAEAAATPLPPGWTSDWELMPSSRGGPGWSWWDAEGGEWHLHEVDPWHSTVHWDYNPWTSWNSPWTNVPHP